MGWNDHHPGIDPSDPDPGETLRGMADDIRKRQKEDAGYGTLNDDPDVGLCIVCGENWCEDTRCERCKRNIEEDRLNRELGQ